MLRKRLFLIVLLMLVIGVGVSAAQESPATLRELASDNGISIGAAAWTYHLDDPALNEILSREFNMLTPEHEAKWCMLSSGPNEYDFSNVDKLVAFAEANDMVIHGHALIWHSCSPEWVEQAEFSHDEAVDALRKHIMTVVGRYKGRIAYWDVVNEAFDNGSLRNTAWLRMIGPEYIELAFQFAHEADPDAKLLYNDYGAETQNPKGNAVYAMAQDFLERGIPIDGIGMQAHFELGGINFGSMSDNIERLGELGLEVQFTEVDIKYPGEATPEIFRKQAADYYHLMETCLDNDNCTAFIVWGVSDKYSWLRNAQYYTNPDVQPLLFDLEYHPKPAYMALMDILARRAGKTSILSDDEIAAILGEEPVATSVIPAPTKSDPNQLAPDQVPGVLYYAPFRVAITLDGDLSDWENIPRALVDSGPSLGSGDTSFEFAAAADATNFYFMADVTDSKLVYGQVDVADWWQEDGVEFYLNTTGDLEASSYVPGIAQIGLMAANLTNPDEPLIGGARADVPVTIVVVQTDKGYAVEASVPLVIAGFWDIVPQHMEILGFQAHLNGSSESSRDTKLIWSLLDTQDQSYNNPSLFGQIMFWDVTQ